MNQHQQKIIFNFIETYCSIKNKISNDQFFVYRKLDPGLEKKLNFITFSLGLYIPLISYIHITKQKFSVVKINLFFNKICMVCNQILAIPKLLDMYIHDNYI